MVSSPFRLSLIVVPAPFRGVADWRCVLVFCVAFLARTCLSQEPLPALNESAPVSQPPSSPLGAASGEPLSGRPLGADNALPAYDEPPPMYIADPLNTAGFAGG